MNPGGFVSQENYDDNIAVVNGHSFKDIKSENTNFALLVSANFTEPFDEPIKYGKYIAELSNMLTGGKIMVQRLKDLKQGKRSTYNKMKKLCYEPTLKDAVPGDLSFALPHRILVALLETLEALDKVGILDKAYVRADQLSGGQQQRVALARALVNNPSMLIADEPTGNLDSKNSHEILSLFKELNEKEGVSILMVTHDAFTASYADRIIFIKDGKIFNEITKGNDTRKQFFEKIIEVQTLLGGELNDVI